eukprot:356623-Chlamydomonas_euryale.AAC.9
MHLPALLCAMRLATPLRRRPILSCPVHCVLLCRAACCCVALRDAVSRCVMLCRAAVLCLAIHCRTMHVQVLVLPCHSLPHHACASTCTAQPDCPSGLRVSFLHGPCFCNLTCRTSPSPTHPARGSAGVCVQRPRGVLHEAGRLRGRGARPARSVWQGAQERRHARQPHHVRPSPRQVHRALRHTAQACSAWPPGSGEARGGRRAVLVCGGFHGVRRRPVARGSALWRAAGPAACGGILWPQVAPSGARQRPLACGTLGARRRLRYRRAATKRGGVRQTQAAPQRKQRSCV